MSKLNERRAGESYAEWNSRVNMPARLGGRERMERDDWEPEYDKWRHGGSYVTNIVYPEGGCGCIASARHTKSGKFQIACGSEEVSGVLHATRRAAAFAERDYAISLWREWDKAHAAK